MEILYIDKRIVAVNKPYGMPSQSDPTGDTDAMSATAGELRARGVSDRLWLVHRLDRTVGGVLVFARTRESAAELSEAFASRGAKKEYLAVVMGEPEGGLYTDYIYKDSAAGKAFVTDRERKGVKAASLYCTPLASLDTEWGRATLVKVALDSGRFHQIRVQLASRGHSIVGDGKYGSRVKCKPMALFSSRLEIGAICVSALPPEEHPAFKLFDRSLFK